MSNQVPPLEDVNFALDVALTEKLTRYGGEGSLADVTAVGAVMGSAEALRWASDANRFSPELVTHDRTGERVDRVDFHPAWHHLMSVSIAAGVHTSPWQAAAADGHVERAGKFFVTSQTEAGHGCPVSMSYAVVPALHHQPELAAQWLPLLLSNEYDPSFQPASSKRGVLFGMGMTERQGGSDVRANITTATAVGTKGPGERYLLNGHKWFCSAPMNDAFLVLAQADGGLSCFLLPRWRENGTVNGFHIERLKNKLGNRSNASGEVVFSDAEARLIGEEGRGLNAIMEMVNHTRLDCVIGATALMRQSVLQAVHHARNRSTFGRRLIDHPLMRNVLSDLSLESEAAMETMFRLASTFDDPVAEDLRRIATPIAKFWVCKRAPSVVSEALECLGGNGYVEESPLPRLYRESPLNSIWEGSGNVICLDVIRAMNRSPESAMAFGAELERGRGHDGRLDDAISRSQEMLAKPLDPEVGARRIVSQLAMTWQATLLAVSGDEATAAAFIDGRLSDPGSTFGGLAPDHIDLVDRVPHLMGVGA